MVLRRLGVCGGSVLKEHMIETIQAYFVALPFKPLGTWTLIDIGVILVTLAGLWTVCLIIKELSGGE